MTALELRRLEKTLEDGPDLDYELWRASSRQYVPILDRGHWTTLAVPRDPYRASFLTGTGTELIYSNTTTGTAKNTFTTEAVINDTSGMGPQAILPPYFWLPSGSVSKAIRVVARGVYSTTSAPTWQTFCRLGGAASTAGPNIGSQTGLIALGSSITNGGWEYELDAQLTIAGATGGNSTIRGLGQFSALMTASSASLALPLFAGAASPGTVATVDISTTNYVNFTAACGTSSASNGITLLQLLVFGLN